MFYTFRDDEVVTMPMEDVTAGELIVGCMTLEELRECYPKLGISDYAMDECVNNLLVYFNSIEVYDNFSFGTISVINMMELKNIRKQVGFFFQQNLFLLIRLGQKDSGEMEEKIRRGLAQVHRPATMEKMICSVLDQLFLSGNQELVFTERMVTVLEQQVADHKADAKLDEELFELRNRISVLKSFADQMLDISETLMVDKNDLLGGKRRLYLRNLATKSERMGERTQTLSDNLLHLWELLDARMNQVLNNTMKVLTIVSLIFQPASVIAGWYGMNFLSMPEFAWKYGYIYVIVLNILVIAALTVYFKKKKLL